MFDELAKHDSIGWDFDETLIGQRASASFRQFVADNPQKRHVIVTFRTGIYLRTMRYELAREDAHFDMARFEMITGIPEDVFFRGQDQFRGRRTGLLTGPLTEPEIEYVHWKGLECRRLGLTALVDDMEAHTRPGCETHGVAFFNSYGFPVVEKA